jgi:hypothetical protein
MEKAINRILIFITVIFIVLTVLLYCGYMLKGFYTYIIIGFLFIASTIAYFILAKNTRRKRIKVIILCPVILYTLFDLSLKRPLFEHKIEDGFKIRITTGGFIQNYCEIIHLTEAKFLIFDKVIVEEIPFCIRDIKRIETINFNQDSAVFLIYHRGEYSYENPYKYKIINENLW